MKVGILWLAICVIYCDMSNEGLKDDDSNGPTQDYMFGQLIAAFFVSPLGSMLQNVP